MRTQTVFNVLFFLIFLAAGWLYNPAVTDAQYTDSVSDQRPQSSLENSIANLKDSDPAVREQAAKELGKAREAGAVDALISVLQYDDVWSVRKSAAWALGEIRDDRALVPLMRAMSHKDWIIRFKVAEALGKLGDRRAAALLTEALQDENSRVYGEAIWALGEIGAERAVDPLIQAMGNELPAIRMNTAEALGKIGDSRAIDSLIQMLAHDRRGDVRKSAAWALGEIGDSRASGALILALKDDDYYVRLYAQLSIEKIGRPAVPLLIAALEEKDITVKSRASWALEGITGEEFGPDPELWKQWLSIH
jgi:HEAT repeat protein